MALRDIGADFESWRTCEWDVNAIRQYKAIHCSDDTQDYSHGKTKEQLEDILLKAGISTDGKNPITKEKISRKSEKWLRDVYNACCSTLNLVDISKATGDSLQIEDKEKYCYILTYSFPCQSLSVAGLQDGMKAESGTSSSLLWEVKRILESLGYSNFWKDMNAKDYGIPQNRNRTFMVSILDKTNQITFKFPKPIKLNKEFSDILEDEDDVDDKFYIYTPRAKELIKKIIDSGELNVGQRTTVDLSLNEPKTKKIANCITAHLTKDGNWIERRRSKNNGVISPVKKNSFCRQYITDKN